MTKLFQVTILSIFLITAVFCQADDSDILNAEQPQTINDLNKTQPSKPSSEPTISTTPPPVRRQFKFDLQTLSTYRYEAGAILGIFLYLILYRRGKSQNYQIMETFYKKTRSYVDQNFSHIGFTKNSGEDPFVAESPNQAMFYASGRENVDYLQIKFNMLKRQDLLYHFIYETIYPQKDTIVIDIPVKTNHPVVFCIANHKKVRHITQRNLDIAKLAGTFQAQGLNASYHVLAESSETVDYLLDANITKKLNQVFPIIYSIHYTDQKAFSQSQGHLRATLFASQRHADKYLPALEVLFQIVDKVYNMKISANYKAKAFKARQAFNASVQKQKLEKHKDQLRKKKQQKRKQQQAWLRSLPPEKQKREDEKRKKKEINKLLKAKVMKSA